jgi:hypothetical protein
MLSDNTIDKLSFIKLRINVILFIGVFIIILFKNLNSLS